MMITADDLVLRFRCKVAVWQVFKHLPGQHDQMTHGMRAGYTGEPGSERNENSQSWFGDSKVVDENGNPQVVYHGTKSDFTEYDWEKSGSSDHPSAQLGFYFTGSADVSGAFDQDNPSILKGYFHDNRRIK